MVCRSPLRTGCSGCRSTVTTSRRCPPPALCPRAGKGPVLIEAITFRMNGRAEHDDASYVPEALVEAWRARTSILERLIEDGANRANENSSSI